MSLARLVVTAVRIEGRSKSEVARDYRVSRRWVHELVKRFDAEGEAGLVPRSRRPHTSPQRTPLGVEDQIVQLRKRLADQGLDAGAHTIAYHLTQRHSSAPAPATIWRILSRRGFVTPQPQKRPRSSYIRFQADMPNQRWQADITHWKLAGGSGVEILNILDDHSRLLVVSHARAVTKAADVVASFHQAAAVHGFPAAVLTDNGAVFTAAARHGRCALELELARLGSPTATPGPITRRPAARSSGSTRPSNAGSPSSPAPRRWPTQGHTHTARGRRRCPPSRPPRQGRPHRGHHPAPQQPAAPHRARPPPHRRPRRHPGGRPGRAGAGRRRPAAASAHPGPKPRLPTTDHNMNDVPGQVCIMSRDITWCPWQDSNLQPAV